MNPIINKRGFGTLVLSAALALTTSFAASAAEYTMKIGLPSTNDPIHRFADHFAEELTRRTGGRIEVKIFPSGQLGTQPAQVEAMQTGIQEALVAPAGNLSGLSKAFQVTDAPGFFDSAQQAHDLINHPDFREKYANLGTNSGVMGASLWIYGPHSYATKDPVGSLADLNGMKLRVLATPMERAIVEQVGVTGVPMPFIESLPAIQRGTVDGVRSMPAVMAPLKYYNTTPHLLKANDGMLTIGLWVSTFWLDSLPEDLRSVVLQTGEETAQWATDFSASRLDEAYAEWEANGGTVTDLTDAERSAHFDNLAGVADQFLTADKASAELWEVLKALKEAQ